MNNDETRFGEKGQGLKLTNDGLKGRTRTIDRCQIRIAE
jgi:hypothetical protein